MRLAALFALVVVGGRATADEPKFTAKLEQLDPPAVAEPVRKLLAPEALVVLRDNGDPVMRVWFRTEVPAMATPDQVKNGLTYREIPEGELVGVIQFPAAFTDYRRQEIAAGTYTLRFAVQPDIGDHTGTAPHPEFCLMCPADKDKSAERIEKKKLIELSSEVNEGKHPAVLLLFPNNAKDAGPKVVPKDNGLVVVNLRRPVAAGDQKTTLGFGITVAGQWKP
ncbi:MAG: hypothetical protein K2P78_07145 [Gemmataceae bacterium]|nr:hypothetical protein [Gemmataceae bacterium]